MPNVTYKAIELDKILGFWTLPLCELCILLCDLTGTPHCYTNKRTFILHLTLMTSRETDFSDFCIFIFRWSTTWRQFRWFCLLSPPNCRKKQTTKQELNTYNEGNVMEVTRSHHHSPVGIATILKANRKAIASKANRKNGTPACR